jgi:hypothetical protein
MLNIGQWDALHKYCTDAKVIAEAASKHSQNVKREALIIRTCDAVDAMIELCTICKHITGMTICFSTNILQKQKKMIKWKLPSL